jgi:hypothetical protein
MYDPSNINNELVGDLTVVIHYKTPCVDTNGYPVLLYFSLGDMLSCNIISGLPAINMLEMLWNIKQGTVTTVGLRSPTYLQSQ